MLNLRRVLSSLCPGTLAILGMALAASKTSAATIAWSGASGTDTNWSTAGNWAGGVIPGGGDDVKFFDVGTNLTVGLPNNLMDAGFGGYIGSLQFGNTNGMHTLAIAAGQTLNITNGNLLVGTPGDLAAIRNLTNTITGAGATLNINNTNAVISLAQGSATSLSGLRANLDLSSLDTFTANIKGIGLGSTVYPNPGNAVQREAGALFLAKTNYITLNFTDTLANYQLAGRTNALELSRNPGNNAGILSLLYLGKTNVINVDSLGFGRDKASATSAGVMAFNPLFSGTGPVAVFRGATGGTSRVTWWAIGDMDASASSSQLALGTNDFSGGSVDALINVLSLGRDCSPSHTAAGSIVGVLTFTAGTVDVNTLYAGNQVLGPSTSTTTLKGYVNVAGASALLKVNTSLVLGRSTATSAAATNSSGIMNITNGTVLANDISVGTYSVTNTINLIGGNLVVSNSLTTNAAGLFTLNVSNATLGLKLTSAGTLRGLVRNLNTIGATNFIQLDAAPAVFASYPQQIPLIKYTAWTGSNTFGLASIPAWAPGAILVSNGANSSLDISLPNDPRPVLTTQPLGYSGAPGDATSFATAISTYSVTPLGYQWYFISGGVTNQLADGAGPSSSSTLTGTTTGTLAIANAQPGDSGSYFLVVTNIYGTTTSSPAVLTISAGNIAPAIHGLSDQTVVQGNNGTFTVTVTGNPFPAVRWQRGGVDIDGATNTTLVVSNVQYAADNGATFSIIASNAAGDTTNNATLTVIVPPTISQQPGNLIVTNTQSATFSVVAAGVPSPGYQWYKNSVAIPGATGSSYTIASAVATNMASYYVQITNSAGTTNSSVVTLTVNSASLAVSTFLPANHGTGICYDSPLYLNFNQPVSLVNLGKIRIYNITNTTTPVDTIDLTLNSTLNPTYAVNVQPRTIGGDTFYSFPVIFTGNQAAVYPHAGVLTSNQTYYVTVDEGVFADTNGAYFIGISSSNTWQFATKATGPANSTNLVVAADGSGDFTTVQGAVDSITTGNTTPTIINIRNGTYREIIDIKTKHNLDLRGQSRSGAVVGYPNNNNVNNSGAPLRAAFIVNGNDCTLENLTLTNMTPKGGSQAEAVDVEGTRIIFYNMELDSYQDTFLVHSTGKMVYFQNCLVQGDTDFNWGYGTVYYTNCELRCLSSGGHVTQPRSSQGSNGFAFVNCRITAGFSSGSFDLGRSIGTPTTPSEVIFSTCLMDDTCTGYFTDAGTNFTDYSCSNLTATAAKSLTFSTHLTSSDPNVIAAQSAATWLYGWQPLVAPLILTNPVGSSASAGSPVIFTVAATGVVAPTYQWLKNGSPISGATNATYTIANAVRANAGSYTVVVSNPAGSATSTAAVLTYSGNVAPTANAASYARPSGFDFKIIFAGDLATNWYDADGDTLSLTGAITSTNGATVSYDGAAIYYSNPNNVTDQINYTLSDGQGGTVAGVIQVTVTAPTGGTVSSVAVVGSSVNMNFAAIPGYQYQIQRSTNLVDWVTLTLTNAPSNGLFQFTDSFTDLGGVPPVSAYYRLVHP